ncbi:MAG: ABC transporter substrate-binding protein [Eubacteriales bacterium]|nr:ABC transporter substrate-binding protein [Clostridium sp.]MDD5981544.1 ABC transporter substrate-binding protein [Clostridium sp.]MDD7503951.1 ABC transporter substrate-binding protein [Clostridium sp.]MDY5756564.1 ABC transporter substrate-binding protein [Eubacteriales bacterium]MDY6089130.1 ABC transporter substrate-binding protein [Eubacteriales bacterium]
MKKYLALVLAIVLSLSMVVGLTGCTKTNKEGSVYYLNFKPEADAAWQALAKKYTELTGVNVKVVTAASGTYNDVLTAEMDKENPPTLFQCGNAGAIKTWGEFCYDLSKTDFYKEMTTDDFNLYGENGELLAAGYCYEAFGIIVNKALLKQAGYEITDIKDFASLKQIADDIHARAEELGFDAFSAAGLDGSSSWRFSGHLANMPLFYQFRDDNIKSQPATITDAYLDNFKNIWDLYTTDSATTGAALLTSTGDESTAQFGNGQAVFYQNGTWEYSNLISNFNMKPEDLAMIPIYCGVEGEEKAALCCGTENCWSVNKNAAEEDIEATLEFMKWVVTSEEGTTMMAEQFGPCPFKKAKEPENVFFADANKYIANGNYVVTWAFNYTPSVDNWRAGVVDALSKYVSGTGDWEAVVNAFVNGWATQYQAENAG